jgi:glucose-6-phosphate 1-epimerase
MDIARLNDEFAMPGVLGFEEHEGLVRAVVTTPAASATVYLHGAHLTHWQPTGEEPVLFMSAKSPFQKDKAIRGGVPVIFPWFGDRHDGHPGPAHGFARTAQWEVGFAALVGEELHLTLTLAPNEVSRELGFDKFRVAYQIRVGKTLTMQFSVANDGEAPLEFEEALHTYFAVKDIRQASVSGLLGAAFLDKRDLDDAGSPKRKTQDVELLVITAPTDRLFLDTAATCVIADQAGGRTITVAKSNSGSTVVWNPWEELTAKLTDMEPEGWVGMLCVETANAASDAITLAPGSVHVMRAVVTVERGA